MQEEPDGDGIGVGWPEGPPPGLVLGAPLGLALGELDGDLLGDAFVLLAAARGRVVPGTAAALGPAWPARPGAPADPVAGDGRALGVVARADVDAAGAGLA